MKKIITVIAILTMILGILPAAAIAEPADEQKETAEYAENMKFLEAVGALENVDYGKDRILTRAEFAKLIVKVAGYEPFLETDASNGAETDLSYLTEKGWVYVSPSETESLSASNTPFADISSDDDEWGAVKFVSTLGFMAADNTYFRPHDNITCGEALRAMSVFLNLGCGQKLTTSEHYAKAMYEGILINVSEKNVTRPLRMKDIAVMLINTLNAEPYIAQYKGKETQYAKEKNYTLLNQLYDVYDDRGTVNANEWAVLNGAEVTKSDEALIGEEIYKTENFDSDELLGHDLKVWYVTDDGDRKLIWYKDETKDDEILSVDAEDIISFENHIFKYWENGKQKSITVKSNMSVVYNGVSVNSYSDDMFTPENGKIVFIRTSGSNNYSMAKITSYGIMIAKSVDYTNELVLADTGTVNRFVVDDYDKTEFFMKDGTEVVFATISKDVVLNIAANTLGKKKRCRVVICNDTVPGKLKSVDEAEKTVLLDSGEYEYDGRFVNFKSIPLNSDITLYFDMDGKAVAYKSKSDTKAAYGYLRKAKYDDNNDDICYIKIYAADDTFKSYEVKDRLILNGKSIKVKKLKDWLMDDKGVTKYQVIKYITDEEGSLEEIITADGKEGDFSKYDISALGVSWVQHRNGGLLAYANGGFSAFLNSGGYVAFAIPKDREDDDNYGIIKTFGHEKQYTFDELYRKSPDSSYIDVCVQLDVTAEKTFDSNAATNYIMLSDVKNCIDENDEEYYELSGQSLSAVSYKCYDDELFDICKELSKGDIVRFNTNSMSGYVTFIKKFYDVGEKRMVTERSTFGEGIYGDNLHPYELFNGWAVDSTDSEQILLAHRFIYADGAPDLTASQEAYTRESARMFKYPNRIICYNSDTNRVSVGSKQDVVYSSDIRFGSTVLVGSYYENGQIMFVIK